jgi:type VI secretion system protein ImpK
MERLKLITQDCFGALLQVRQTDAASLPAPDLLHQKLRSFIDEMLRRAAELGFSHQDAQDIGYALVAFADELVVGKSEALREYWPSNLLQFHYFRENRAGEGFFTRLQAIRADVKRREVLQAYYLCLLFGFQGRYRVRGGELELMQLTESLHRDLSLAFRYETDTLSPRGERPPDSLVRGRNSLPLVAAAGAAVVFALLVYGGLRLALHSSTTSFVEQLSLSTQPDGARLP